MFKSVSVGPTAAPEESRETRVLFTCDMLLKQELSQVDATPASEWSGMTCDDPDDLLVLKERRWSTETEYKAGEAVILWRKDSSAAPHEDGGYVRSGKVIKNIVLCQN